MTSLVRLTTLRNHDQTTITAPSQEEPTVWAHEQGEDRVVLRGLKSSESLEARQVTHENNAFFCAVDKFIDLVGRFDNKGRNDVRRFLIADFLLDVCVDDRRSIDRERVPVVIVAREESAHWNRVLCQDRRVDSELSGVAESPDQASGPQVVHVYVAIGAGRDEKAHLFLNED